MAATIIDWPAIRASYISGYDFEGGRSVKVELQSGGVYEDVLSTTVRCWVTLHYNGLRTNRSAPAPYAAFSEARCIRDLLILLGQGAIVRLADPVDGTLRLWKLDARPAFRRVPKTKWYEAEVPLRSPG